MANGLCQEIVNIFAKELETIFKREAEEKEYMKQTILGCRYRSFIAIFTAVRKSFKPMYKLLALSIAVHRQESHNEDKTKTIESLSRGLSSETVEKASSSWWDL